MTFEIIEAPADHQAPVEQGADQRGAAIDGFIDRVIVPALVERFQQEPIPPVEAVTSKELF